MYVARAPHRRARRYLAATALAVVALIGAGIGYRASVEDLGRYAQRKTAQAMDALERLQGEASRSAPPPPPPARRRSR
jgi:hypothetical protein